MKKILLILALALVCSFNANAQTNGEELVKATKKRVVTAEEAVSKEAAKEAEFTEEAAKEEEFVEEKAYAEEAVKEAVPVPAEAKKALESLDKNIEFKEAVAIPSDTVKKEKLEVSEEKFEAVAVPAEEVVAREVEKAYAEKEVAEKVKAICVDCEKQKAVPEKKMSVSSEPCVTYTAEQALDATVEGNNNTFAAVYSTNATRRCGGNKIDEAAPVLKLRAQEDDLRELNIRDLREWNMK